MKQRFYFISLISSLLFIVSCKKDYLDNVTNKGVLLRQDYVVDLKTTEEYNNGTYALLGANLFNGYHIIYPDLIADNIKPIIAATGNTPLIIHYKWAQVANEVNTGLIIPQNALNCNSYSYGAYQVILSCNFVLEKGYEYRDQDINKSNSIRGQAHAIRALTYFNLVNFFAQPYEFTPGASHPGLALMLSSDWTEPVKSRSSVADVYNQIIADLNEAIKLLPAGTSSPLKFNRNAAMALLSRVYLFKGDFLAAKNLAVEILRNVPIMTANYPAKLFTPEETEALFQVFPAPTGAGYTTNFANYYFRSRIQFRATTDINTLLSESPTDLRKSWITPASANLNITKYPSGVLTDPITDRANAYYHTLIRSSEMSLTAAESYARLNMEDSARYYLNAIQTRAQANVTDNTVTGSQLLDAIYKERRKELAFEGLRMFDLLRWKKGVSRTDAADPTVKELPYPSNKAIAPIPGLDVTVQGLAQNAGY